jgi:hypothetical protein
MEDKMAKQAVQKTDEKLPATELDELMKRDAGKGISNKAEDNLIPQIKVLQPLSPQVLDGPNQVPGAKAGDFLLAGRPLDGKKGFWFQPAQQEQLWLEFRPLDRGGGFVAGYPFMVDPQGRPIPPPGAKHVEKYRYKMDNGNEVVHYRQMAGILWEEGGVGLEYVISFKGTGHSVAKAWMTEARRANRFEDGRQRPLFGHIYHLTTSQRRNAQGQWYVIDVGPAILLNKAPQEIIPHDLTAYHLGHSLSQAFETKEKMAAAVDIEEEPDRDVM